MRHLQQQVRPTEISFRRCHDKSTNHFYFYNYLFFGQYFMFKNKHLKLGKQNSLSQKPLSVEHNRMINKPDINSCRS